MINYQCEKRNTALAKLECFKEIIDRNVGVEGEADEASDKTKNTFLQTEGKLILL